MEKQKQTMTGRDSLNFPLEFRKMVSKYIWKFAKLSEDGYIHLPKKIEIEVIDHNTATPRLRIVKVWRLTPDMHIVDGHGQWYPAEMVRVFEWENIIRSYETEIQKECRKAQAQQVGI